MILVLVAIFSSAMESTPPAAGGTTALIVWMLSMFLMIFVAFLIYCIRLFFKVHNVVKTAKEHRTQTTKDGKPEEEKELKDQMKVEKAKDTILLENHFSMHEILAKDLTMLAVLSLLFLFYIIVYLIVYV